MPTIPNEEDLYKFLIYTGALAYMVNWGPNYEAYNNKIVNTVNNWYDFMQSNSEISLSDFQTSIDKLLAEGGTWTNVQAAIFQARPKITVLTTVKPTNTPDPANCGWDQTFWDSYSNIIVPKIAANISSNANWQKIFQTHALGSHRFLPSGVSCVNPLKPTLAGTPSDDLLGVFSYMSANTPT